MENIMSGHDVETDFILSRLKEVFAKTDKAHDYSHTLRVFHNALEILEQEEANGRIVGLAALLHDVDDHKFSDNPDENKIAKEILGQIEINEGEKAFILEIIGAVSFSKGRRATSAEARIVQDADRLDAIGAIGIARTFTYGGKADRPIYDQDDSCCSVQHFYDKLLKIEGLISTETAKRIAAKRTAFMKEYLKQLYSELKVDAPIY